MTVAADPICLACGRVLVKDGALSCDLHRDGIPSEVLAGREGCEEMDVEFDEDGQ